MDKLIKVMGISILLHPRFNMLQERIKQYEIDPSSKYDEEISFTEEQFEKAHKEFEGCSDELIEYILTGHIFNVIALSHDAFMIHSSVVALPDGYAYAFSGMSGVGKSTHASLYLKYFDDSFIINDDKAVYRYDNGEFSVYGSPWSGKNDISKNVSRPLRAICFIKQGKSNEVRCLGRLEAIKKICEQTYIPKSPKNRERFFSLLDEFISKIKVFEIDADISKDAMEASYKAMKGDV